jgi:hypothetical protein
MHVLSASRARGEAEENNSQPVMYKWLRVLQMPLTSGRIWRNVILSCAAISFNWLHVFGTAERSQMHQRVRQHLHARVPLLDAFNPYKQPLAHIFPRQRPLDPSSYCVDGGVEPPLAPALGALTVAGMLLDVGDDAGVENAHAIRSPAHGHTQHATATERPKLAHQSATPRHAWGTPPRRRPLCP